MRRNHSLRWLAAGLAVIAGTALADVSGVQERRPSTSRERVLELGRYSPACEQFRSLPADSRSELLPWEQKLSTAACQQALVFMPVSDPEGLRPMVAGIEHALAPSIAIYRDALANGPPQIKILAAYGLGMTYINIAVRARSSIRSAGASYGGVGYGGAGYFDELKRMHDALEPLLTADLKSALDAFDEVAVLADKYPDAARANAVVANAIANARAEAEMLR